MVDLSCIVSKTEVYLMEFVDGMEVSDRFTAALGEAEILETVYCIQVVVPDRNEVEGKGSPAWSGHTCTGTSIFLAFDWVTRFVWT